MKSASSQLATHINGGTTTLATCWKVTRRDGAVFGFTDFDKDLTVDSLDYLARSGYTRSAIHTIANLAVDSYSGVGKVVEHSLDERWQQRIAAAYRFPYFVEGE